MNLFDCTTANMKAKLYSVAHLETAKKLFPSKANQEDWLDFIWTDAEINACKLYEMEAFINAPSLSTYPHSGLLDPQSSVPEELRIVDRYLSSLTMPAASFLSVGCGLGEKELRLARTHPNVSFVAVDNAPHVECLNKLASELGLRNIIFRNCDLKTLAPEKYDVVYSFSVIYCISDRALPCYFNLLINNLGDNGVAFVGDTSNYNLILKCQLFVLRCIRIIMKRNTGLKQTGWLRDLREIYRFIPNSATIGHVFQLDHLIRSRFLNKTGLGQILRFFSEKCFPISNSSYMFVLRKAL